MNKELGTSLAFLLAAILIFSFVLVGGASFIIAGILVLMSIILFCVFLRKHYSLDLFMIALIFIGLITLFAMIYVAIIYASFILFHP
ncbi:hypothetical protein [Alkalibacillus almallahensis]|uniref:hypothetical protein n=1 Tax=Alkalibacillus almallahensis TaxID=1379154 RepID=UPI00142184E7|nr:hypothetical protein [Alkalibacillus almallahensis]NIK11649.1 hypothetical protein [Alkalibacillus almallahensis]